MLFISIKLFFVVVSSIKFQARIFRYHVPLIEEVTPKQSLIHSNYMVPYLGEAIENIRKKKIKKGILRDIGGIYDFPFFISSPFILLLKIDALEKYFKYFLPPFRFFPLSSIKHFFRLRFSFVSGKIRRSIFGFGR